MARCVDASSSDIGRLMLLEWRKARTHGVELGGKPGRHAGGSRSTDGHVSWRSKVDTTRIGRDGMIDLAVTIVELMPMVRVIAVVNVARREPWFVVVRALMEEWRVFE